MKSIRLSNHARKRMAARGATEDEVMEAIRSERWQPALQNKMQVKKIYMFERPSPVNQKVYKFKTVQVVFVEEAASITVVTVIVYYGDKESMS